MRRQPQARGTKSKARIDAYYDLEEKTKNGGPKAKVELSVKTARQGNKIMEIAPSIAKLLTSNTFIDNFNYVFKKGDRIGFAGKNGSGKSTLLNMITGAYSRIGVMIEKGETTVMGYFHQSGIVFKEDERVIDIVKNVAEFITMADGKTDLGLCPAYFIPISACQTIWFYIKIKRWRKEKAAINEHPDEEPQLPDTG